MKVPDGYKRCKCRDGAGRELGAACPRLRRKDKSWNPSHGTWAAKISLPAADKTPRAFLRAGGFESRDGMRDWFTRAIALLDIPEAGPDGHGARLEILALIQQARDDGSDLPAADDIQRRYSTGAAFEPGSTRDYLLGWLARHKKEGDWTETTLAEYTRITMVRLIPHLGKVALEKLREAHIWDMFDAIDAESQRIIAARASADPEVRKSVAGMRPAGIATKRRHLAVLRSALADAASSAPGRPRLLAVNVAAGIKFGREGGTRKTARSKARLWTRNREAAWRRDLEQRIAVTEAGWRSDYARRVAERGTAPRPGPVPSEELPALARYLAWENTAARPSNVMIWTPDHLGAFLDAVEGDRLYPMFAVIAYCGLRRGEACGLRWEDVDWESGSVMIGPTIVQAGWKAIEKEDAKAGASDDWVRLEAIVIGALRDWRRRQLAERLAWGEAWTDTGYVFTMENGRPYHPSTPSDRFHRLSFEHGLPPIRLHDLRHGAATLALAAGKSMKEVSAMLRHSSEAITSDIYASVLPELKAATSAAVASMVPRKRKA